MVVLGDMKIQLGKRRKFIVDGAEVMAVPTQIDSVQKYQRIFIREILSPHNSYWYNPKTKEKLIP